MSKNKNYEIRIRDGKAYKVYVQQTPCMCHPETCSHIDGLIVREIEEEIELSEVEKEVILKM